MKIYFMKRFTIFSILFLTGMTVFGQVNHSGFTPKPGIYRSLDELINNTPSSELSFRTYSSALSGVVYQHLDVDRGIRKETGRALAFSDGNKLFVNFNNPRVRRCAGFSEVEKIGQYMVYWDVDWVTVEGATFPVAVQRYFDPQSGRVKYFNRITLRKIIDEKPELLAKFNNEKRKGTKLRDYLREFVVAI